MWWFVLGGWYEGDFLNLEVIFGKSWLDLMDVLVGV